MALMVLNGALRSCAPVLHNGALLVAVPAVPAEALLPGAV